MKRIVFAVAFLLLLLAAISPLRAGPKVLCDVKKIREHGLLVTFSWKVKVKADHPRQACDLILSFRDHNGKEIYTVKEIVQLKTGHNQFEGVEICEKERWKKMVKVKATLDCVF
ncbi:MAG: hypothetical protein JRH13_10965 [Deltaproteobacteria bacterium]|nr:hypothetical protein [Deltaproteobacteria bacterium]MBW2017108.1 hypothetical protein [Deltaproteobacteria bacterium]MBW2129872.1 hypothetical protein [Deltaproteobacteria bacterium]MBW2303109.1 hypothetical protein [Deltaproteobacteria bacterium]